MSSTQGGGVLEEEHPTDVTEQMRITKRKGGQKKKRPLIIPNESGFRLD